MPTDRKADTKGLMKVKKPVFSVRLFSFRVLSYNIPNIYYIQLNL